MGVAAADAKKIAPGTGDAKKVALGTGDAKKVARGTSDAKKMHLGPHRNHFLGDAEKNAVDAVKMQSH